MFYVRSCICTYICHNYNCMQLDCVAGVRVSVYIHIYVYIYLYTCMYICITRLLGGVVSSEPCITRPFRQRALYFGRTLSTKVPCITMGLFPQKSPILRQDSFHKSAMYYDVLLYCMYVYTHSNIYMHIYIYIDIYIDIRRYSIYRYI